MFRRQLTILRIACAHAVMLINRPLMLSRNIATVDIQPHVEACLSATKEALDVVLDLATSGRVFFAFWNTQYVTFNTLSIAYVWITQRKIGRLANVQSRYREDDLFELAETVHSHLATITQKNAPNLRYSLILGELQSEARRAVCTPHSTSSGDPGTSSSSSGQGPASVNSAAQGQPAEWELNSVEFPLDPDLWLQLDAFPFTDPYFHEDSAA